MTHRELGDPSSQKLPPYCGLTEEAPGTLFGSAEPDGPSKGGAPGCKFAVKSERSCSGPRLNGSREKL